LWQSYSSLLPLALLYAVTLIFWFTARERFGPLMFYLIFAIVVTASVQIVGIYLVFASLIIPALATTGLRRGNRLMVGYFIGALSYLVGIVLSFYMDLPTGAVIVWSMALIAVSVGFVISDKRGEA